MTGHIVLSSNYNACQFCPSKSNCQSKHFKMPIWLHYSSEYNWSMSSRWSESKVQPPIFQDPTITLYSHPAHAVLHPWSSPLSFPPLPPHAALLAQNTHPSPHPTPLANSSSSLRSCLRRHFLQEALLASPVCPEMYFLSRGNSYIHLHAPIDTSLSHSTRIVLCQQERAVLSLVRAHSAPTRVWLIMWLP